MKDINTIFGLSLLYLCTIGFLLLFLMSVS